MCVIFRGLAYGRTVFSKRNDFDVGGLALEGARAQNRRACRKGTILEQADVLGRTPARAQNRPRAANTMDFGIGGLPRVQNRSKTVV